MRILFLSNLFSLYENILRKALSELNLSGFTISDQPNEKVDEVEFIIYSPTRKNKAIVTHDFTSYRNNKAIFRLYAGVEPLINNNTIDCPLVKMVDNDHIS